jgi:3-oxoacyl-[acyl-carrier protein] reductase
MKKNRFRSKGGSSARERTIFVTGATGAIGSALCRRLSQGGSFLVLGARNNPRLNRLVRELRSNAKRKSLALPFDFANLRLVDSAMSRLRAQIDGLDGLVLILPPIQAVATSLPDNKTWQALFRKYFVSPLAMIRGCIPLLAKKQQAKVVFVSGVSSVQLVSNYPISGVIRAAWLAETKALAFEYGHLGIRFNTLSLGSVMTPRTAEHFAKNARQQGVDFDEFMADQLINVPLRQYANTENVAEVIETMLSSFCEHMSGANVVCEGGFIRSY